MTKRRPALDARNRRIALAFYRPVEAPTLPKLSRLLANEQRLKIQFGWFPLPRVNACQSK